MPKNFDHIKKTCLKSKELTSSVIDEFLIYYAGEKANLHREVKKRFNKYRHAINEVEPGWINMFISQYIAHRIFQEGGFINKTINHSALNFLDEEEMDFLRHNQQHPWKFSVSVIINNPAPDFYTMQDVFTEESFLLYSPGVTKIRAASDVALWLNLITYNGDCWETYGPICHYRSFEASDILFFTSLLYPHNFPETGEDIMAAVAKNPVPYMVLYLNANQPLIFSPDNHQFVHLFVEYLDENFDSTMLKDRFTMEYSNNVFRMSLNDWSEHPHFSYAYYDEKNQVLALSAFSHPGFEALVDTLNACGYQLSYSWDFRVNPAMLAACKNIFRQEIQLNPYDSLFEKDDHRTDAEKKEFENTNKMLEAIIPDLNSGIKPDAAALAKRFNVDRETTEELINQLWEKYGAR